MNQKNCPFQYGFTLSSLIKGMIPYVCVWDVKFILSSEMTFRLRFVRNQDFRFTSFLICLYISIAVKNASFAAKAKAKA